MIFVFDSNISISFDIEVKEGQGNGFFMLFYKVFPLEYFRITIDFILLRLIVVLTNPFDAVLVSYILNWIQING